MTSFDADGSAPGVISTWLVTFVGYMLVITRIARNKYRHVLNFIKIPLRFVRVASALFDRGLTVVIMPNK